VASSPLTVRKEQPGIGKLLEVPACGLIADLGSDAIGSISDTKSAGRIEQRHDHALGHPAGADLGSKKLPEAF